MSSHNGSLSAFHSASAVGKPGIVGPPTKLDGPPKSALDRESSRMKHRAETVCECCGGSTIWLTPAAFAPTIKDDREDRAYLRERVSSVGDYYPDAGADAMVVISCASATCKWFTVGVDVILAVPRNGGAARIYS